MSLRLGPRLVSRVCLFGGSLLTVGSGLLPWVAVDGINGQVTLTGVTAFSRISPVFNGVVTALLAAVVVLLALDDREASLAGAGAVGLAIAAVAGVYVVDPVIAYGDAPAGVLTAKLTTARVGVFLTVAGGAVVLAGGIIGAAEAASAVGAGERNGDAE